MDSYHLSSLTNRPASEPIPDLNLPSLPDLNLPLTPADSDTSPSGRSSGVPQPIDFGGSGASQSRRTSVPQIEYGNASQNGGATGSSASQRTSSRSPRTYTEEEKSRAISGLQQALENKSSTRKYSKYIGIPRTTLRRWQLEVRGSLQSQRTDTDESSSRGAR